MLPNASRVTSPHPTPPAYRTTELNEMAGGRARPEQVRLVGRGSGTGGDVRGHDVAGRPRRQGEGGRGRGRVLPGEGEFEGARHATATTAASVPVFWGVGYFKEL